jgi:FKBP-type peptidyl-prolyl cis-trans isomerase FklB
MLAGALFAQDVKPARKTEAQAARPEIKTVNRRVSYGIGQNIGQHLRSQGFDVDLKLLVRGITDALAQKKPLVSQKDFQEAIAALQEQIRAKREKEGVDFLAANKKKKGVITTKSGLQYQVLKAGIGRSPTVADTVKTHYHGTLIDGTVFDSSVERGKPATLEVDGVIDGWTEALQLMKVGAKWRLFIPSELAYGMRGSPPDIAPNTVLVFEIELLVIE